MIESLEKASFLYDEKGERTHVLLPVANYEELLEALEDTGLLRAMQETDNDEIFSLEQALNTLEA